MVKVRIGEGSYQGTTLVVPLKKPKDRGFSR
jgi:hypothetical protein